MFTRLANVICAATLLAACTAPSPPRPRLQSPEYGLQVFLWWTSENKTGDNDVRLVQDLGFGWLKQKFPWREIEVGRGQFDWSRSDPIVALAEKHKMKLLARLDVQPWWAQADPAAQIPNGPPADYQDFGRYCSAVASRYKGRIPAYEVWNEPNLAREWGQQPPNPQEYVELLKVCYQAIKAADPPALVISAGLAPNAHEDPAVALPDDVFYRAMYEAGAAPYFDLLGVHAPGWMNPPEVSPDETEADPALQARWVTFRHVEDIRQIMVAYGDGDKQIAITEMGYTIDPRPDSPYHWHAVTEAQRADYLPRMYQYAKAHWSPWIGPMIAIYIVDESWTENDEQYWWAITRPVFPGDPPVLLPSYEALKKMEK